MLPFPNFVFEPDGAFGRMSNISFLNATLLKKRHDSLQRSQRRLSTFKSQTHTEEKQRAINLIRAQQSIHDIFPAHLRFQSKTRRDAIATPDCEFAFVQFQPRKLDVHRTS